MNPLGVAIGMSLGALIMPTGEWWIQVGIIWIVMVVVFLPFSWAIHRSWVRDAAPAEPVSST